MSQAGSRQRAMDLRMTSAPEDGCLNRVSFADGRVPQRGDAKSARHPGMPLAALQQSFLGTKPKDDDTPRYRALSLSQSSLRSASSRCFSPSPTSTPTNYSFGPRSPNSLNSGFQSPPSIAGMSFCHSREPSLDDALPVGTPKSQDLFSSLRAATKPKKGHRHGAASADSSIRYRHRPVQSIDWAGWRQTAEEPEASPDREPKLENEDDDDLIAYRREVGVKVTLLDDAQVSSGSDACALATEVSTCSPDQTQAQDGADSTLLVPQTPPRETPFSKSATPSDSNDVACTPCSDGPSPISTSGCYDDDINDRAEEIARVVLKEGFDLRLGSSELPQNIVTAVRDCLEDISLSLQRARAVGFVAATTSSDSPASSATPSSEASLPDKPSGGNRKRSARGRADRDDGMQEEDDDGDGDAEAVGHSEPGGRKKPKFDHCPCPFRKRNPVRFNCREWEYCAKAPFKSMTELKKHIIKYHYQQELVFKCIRCRERFARMEDLETHMMVDAANICEARPGLADQRDEEIINDAVVDRLRSRTEQFDWEKLWETLFPRDTKVPEPEFEPIVELHEVDQGYQNGWPIFQQKLSMTLETLLSIRGGLSDRDMLQCRLIMGSTLENIVQEFITSFFQESRAKATKPFEPTPRGEANATEARTARPVARASSLTSTRPTSLASSSSRSGPRSLRPNIAPRGSDRSSYHSNASSPSSSARQSGVSFGTSYRTSFAESLSSSRHGPSPHAAITQPAPVSAVTLPSRPAQANAPVTLPKWITPLRDEVAGSHRDSAITDMGCPNCLLGLACQCAATYFDIEAYMQGMPPALGAPGNPSLVLSEGSELTDNVLFQDHMNMEFAGTDPRAWNMGNFSG
ncbi:hypothetical protein B0T16DRAFT_444376 [Cercophora newfieldiana]|uniref:C2H2-type domain-containing protein n=1 Tax=Cercophora newfieldiana TaxID=92897 RepID=A0AA39Y921_9PEZI|nr:hypothetical protein B0T16DRAFT_444376 [Cercophora newfieldiana]